MNRFDAKQIRRDWNLRKGTTLLKPSYVYDVIPVGYANNMHQPPDNDNEAKP